MTNPLAISIAGVTFANPVIAASGTFGYGREYAGLLSIESLGGICTKGLTALPRPGNRGTRLHETPAGLLNSIGLENPGIPAFLSHELPALSTLGPVVIANLSGSTVDEYVDGARLLSGPLALGVRMIELNISCPNVKAGGMAFGLDPTNAFDVTTAVRQATNKPLIVKLSPNAGDLCTVARACVDAGADALSLVNTFKAMAIDVNRRTPVFANVSAGLSGPAIKPIALRMVWEVASAVRVPIIGMGGIANTTDALEFILAGATAVQVGSATFPRPTTMVEIINGLRDYLAKHQIPSIGQLVGGAR